MIGIGLLVFQTKSYDLDKRNSLLEHVKIIRSAINVDRILTLNANENDYTNPDYVRLKDQLTQISDSVHGIKYIYLMGINKNIFFYVDTQPSSFGEAGLAVPGEIYTEANSFLSGLFTKKGEVIVGPETDKWGTFVSGMASIVDKNDKVVAVVGIDVETDTWFSDLWILLVKEMFILILILVIEIIYYLNLKKNNNDNLKLAYLAAVLEASGDAIYSIDFDEKILSWNIGAEKLYGYTAQEALNKNASEILIPHEQLLQMRDDLSKIKAGRRVGYQERIRKNKKGELMTLSLIMSPVYNNSNEIASVSIIARDVTKQKIKDLELERHNAELEKMNRLMIDRELTMMDLKKKIKHL